MYNIAWYARDGHLDLFPHIAARLIDKGVQISSHYVCHHVGEQDHLQSRYNIGNIQVLANFLKKKWEHLDVSEEAIRNFKVKYDAVPLIRCLWGDLFELNLSEAYMIRNFIGHMEFWEGFLVRNNINMLVSELPSILSTCVAWLICKKHNIAFSAFLNIPQLDSRMVISGSWYGHYEGLEERIRSQKIVEGSDTYRKAIKYLKEVGGRPQKTEDAIANIKYLKRNAFLPLDSIKLILKQPSIWRLWQRQAQKEQYYIKKTLSDRLLQSLRFYLNSYFHKVVNMFDSKVSPEEDRFFLFPLHMLGEWSSYASFGLGYADQIRLVKQVAACIPVGVKLYVKEHTANFGEKPLSFYREIKNLHRVRLIHPFADTFKLIRYCQGIVTLYSSMGFEAMMLGKPVFVLGEPWYRNLPDIYGADSPLKLAELLQDVRRLPVASDEEKLKVVYALYDMSFNGVRWPHERTLEPENIEEFAKAIQHRIEGHKENGSTEAACYNSERHC